MNLYVNHMKAYRSVRRALNPNRRQGKRRKAYIKLIMRDRELIRDRSYYEYCGLEKHFGFDMVVFLKNVAKAHKPIVTEIGGGKGNTIKDLTTDMRKENIDIITRNIELPKDALKVTFPKSHLILSQWALGYIGHPNFMTRKIAEALEPGGIALLHFNKKHLNRSGNEVDLENWSPFLDRLVKAKERLENCKVRGYKLRENVASGLYQFLKGDYFVLIRKLGLWEVSSKK